MRERRTWRCTRTVDASYILVDTEVAPEVFVKVVEAKRLLASGKYKTTNEALAQAKISRSAFYKYKNHVYACGELGQERIITLAFVLDDVAGVLSEILGIMAAHGTNILTINQNIPVNNIANMTITLRMNDMDTGLAGLLDSLKAIRGVNRAEILAMN